MASLAPDARIAISDNQDATTVDDTIVVLNHDTGEYLGLHGIGPHVWEQLEESPTIQHLIDTISTEFGVSETQCESDLLAFITEMHEKELITIEDGSPR